MKKKQKRILEGMDDQKDFQVVQNRIYYTRNGRMQLYLPMGKFRDLIMQECHNTRYAGHLGVRKTTDLIFRDFYWPMVQADVATCEECQRNKPSNLRPARLLQPLEVPGHR